MSLNFWWPSIIIVGLLVILWVRFAHERRAFIFKRKAVTFAGIPLSQLDSFEINDPAFFDRLIKGLEDRGARLAQQVHWIILRLKNVFPEESAVEALAQAQLPFDTYIAACRAKNKGIFALRKTIRSLQHSAHELAHRIECPENEREKLLAWVRGVSEWSDTCLFVRDSLSKKDSDSK